MAARPAPSRLGLTGDVTGSPVEPVPPRTERRTRPASRKGKPRLGDGGRTWQAKLYEPSDGYPSWRMSFKDPQSKTWTTRVVLAGEDPNEAFDRLERALDGHVEQPGRRSKPTMSDLKERYLAWLRAKRRSKTYLAKVDNLLDVWVMRARLSTNRTAATLLVENWTAEHSQGWIDGARQKVGPARVEDLGVALAGMRRAAQRRDKDTGLRWMALDDNPLEDVDYSRHSTIEGAHRDYVPFEQRPTTDHVEDLIRLAEQNSLWPWMPTQLRVGAYCGPRLSEQLAIRDVDVDLVERELVIRNTVRWPAPTREIDWGLTPIKTRRWRRVPYPPSLHEPLLDLVRCSLELPPEATIEQVGAAQAALYRRLAPLDQVGQRDGRDLTDDDHLLFTDTLHGKPPTKEAYGEAFRKLRSRSTWPGHLPWRNARHHCAAWWMRHLRDPHTGEPVGHHVLASWLGHSTQTFRNHYLLAGEDEKREAKGWLNSC